MPSIAIVILNYNTSFDCVKCVSFLKRQSGVNYEIIVVDNCSNQEDISQLVSFCNQENVTLLQSRENMGYSAGNNIGLRYAAEKGCEYALIINPDVEIEEKNYLLKLLNKIESDDNIAVIGSDTVNTESFHQNPMREIGYWEELFWFLDFIKTKYTYITDYEKSGYCEKLSGCCFIIRMSFVKQIGFLDENTFLYCEESILAKQVKMAAKKMYYMADLSAKHVHIKSEKGCVKNRIELAVKSRIYYLVKYSEYSKHQLRWLVWSKRLYLALVKRLL
ncbi:MAG: glycosyltransferase family 2 protein [Candidatus Symbiothrix sp.]|jgi:GT2 family glycosyltransferase|nr:glycosyltransferase family 2 protein [Candidatus Symbiothrix sp.]